MEEKIHFLGDNPIKNSEEDLFNFKHYAEKLQKLIQLNSSNPEPLTFGIYGKWGEGKTTFLNLLENKIDHFEKNESDKEFLKFHFNPWRYSSEDEMLFDFFDSLSKMFYVDKFSKYQEVGKWIKKYGKYLKAIKISSSVGIPKILNTKVEFDVSEIFKSLGEDLEGENLTLENLKEKVNLAIQNANFKVVVFIDDLDRLDKSEIYTILKLIKLNASFNNFIFIVNLDIDHVSKAIKDRFGEDIEDGKIFLEKIINIPIHLPKIESEDLQLFFEKKFAYIIKSLDSIDKDVKKEELKKIMQKFSSDFFKSPREIIRVLNSFFTAAFGFEDEINLTDLFWIEWLKIKAPAMYDVIKNYNVSGLKGLFIGQDRIINFNDQIDLLPSAKLNNYEQVINGTRKNILENYSEFKEIFELLFPNKMAREVDVTVFENNLNINATIHFDKYFSYHTERKIKNTDVIKIGDLIIRKDSEHLRESINELFKTDHQKGLFTLENIIKKFSKISEQNSIESRDFLYKFIFNNLDLVPESRKDMFGENFRTRIIKLIAGFLNQDQENEKTVLDLANSLESSNLISYLIAFDNDKEFVKKIEQVFVEKEKKNLGSVPFYNQPENLTSRWFIDLWKKYEPENFKKYIEENLKNIHDVKCLIRNFPNIFNDSKFSPLTRDKFDYMDKVIDTDFIFSKIKEFQSDLIENVESGIPDFDDFVESSMDENLRQFIYWYKKREAINSKIDIILK